MLASCIYPASLQSTFSIISFIFPWILSDWLLRKGGCLSNVTFKQFLTWCTGRILPPLCMNVCNYGSGSVRDFFFFFFISNMHMRVLKIRLTIFLTVRCTGSVLGAHTCCFGAWLTSWNPFDVCVLCDCVKTVFLEQNLQGHVMLLWLLSLCNYISIVFLLHVFHLTPLCHHRA